MVKKLFHNWSKWHCRPYHELRQLPNNNFNIVFSRYPYVHLISSCLSVHHARKQLKIEDGTISLAICSFLAQFRVTHVKPILNMFLIRFLPQLQFFAPCTTGNLNSEPHSCLITFFYIKFVPNNDFYVFHGAE